MAHGVNDYLYDNVRYQRYYRDVIENIEELKTLYPFTSYVRMPSVQPQPIQIRTIAAEQKLIRVTGASEQDFLGTYSKELQIIVPFNYRTAGCQVFGGKWINENSIPNADQHFYKRNSDGLFLLCVGVPESFSDMKNVILENVRTADKMLTAYEIFQKGQTSELKLLAYSHGDKGRNEYKYEHAKRTNQS